jgi:hypothetical protein
MKYNVNLSRALYEYANVEVDIPAGLNEVEQLEAVEAFLDKRDEDSFDWELSTREKACIECIDPV